MSKGKWRTLRVVVEVPVLSDSYSERDLRRDIEHSQIYLKTGTTGLLRVKSLSRFLSAKRTRNVDIDTIRMLLQQMQTRLSQLEQRITETN